MARPRVSPTSGSMALRLLFAAACNAALWVLFVGTGKLHEMLVGAAVVVVCTLFTFKVLTSQPIRVHLRAVDLMQLWRVPWYIVSGTWEIILILMKDLLGTKAGSYFRYSGFRSSMHDPVRIAQTVLATAYTSAAPNFIVIGIDPAQSHMLFHQLERSTVPKMTQNLGAHR